MSPTGRQPAEPHKMPGQYWAYGFYLLLGVPVIPFVFNLTWQQVGALRELAALPAAAAGARGAAVHRGVLDGDGETTPLGKPAAVWLGRVTRSTRQGKSSTSAEMCLVGGGPGLRLVERAGGSTPIVMPALRDIETDLDFRGTRSMHPRYWLGATETVSPLPDAVIERCHLDRAAMNGQPKTRWTYVEQRAARGVEAELAGCRDGGVLAACRDGGAGAGHLSVPGIRALVLRLADSTMLTFSLLVGLMSFFTVVMALGATLALRRAAARGGDGARR